MSTANGIAQRLRDLTLAVKQYQTSVPRQYEARIGEVENRLSKVAYLTTEGQPCSCQVDESGMGMLVKKRIPQVRTGYKRNIEDGADARRLTVVGDICLDPDGHVLAVKQTFMILKDGKMVDVTHEAEITPC